MRQTLALVALLAGACAAQPTVVATAPVAPSTVAVTAPPIANGDQWLYGSAEASVATRQAYKALTDYAVATAEHRSQSSVILAPGSSPIGTAPTSFVACGVKPLAAVFDADETLIWNVPPRRASLLLNGGKFDPVLWSAWERTGAGRAVPVPGAVAALAALRAAGITPIVNSNRSASTAAGSAATLKAAGLGDFVHGQTLFLMGDDQYKGSKDERRARIAARYCVIAMAGDQLGDFSNAFNDPNLPPAERRAAATTGPAAALWGRGWFLLPNASYGPWEKLKFGDVYGTDAWDPAQGAN
jgi:5'-nucleotidase (lipoprotein e(P4) family)